MVLPLQCPDHIASPSASLSMPAMPLRQSRLVLAAAAALALAGCGAFNDATHRFASSLTPYKVEIVQGNFVSKEQVDALQPGMSREQVRQVLGTPLVTDMFHANRWDYVFTMKRQGVPPQERHLVVFFKGDAMDHVQGDPMPSESEFVATIDKHKPGKIPPLEATEAQLKAFAAKQPAAPASAVETEPAAPTNYPPLEPGAR
jgi:outer membrane protein assembly factor BamE